MSQFEFDDMDDLNEEYYFDTIEEFQSERYFVLVIYDIVDNKKRLKLSQYLLGYGTVSYTHLTLPTKRIV